MKFGISSVTTNLYPLHYPMNKVIFLGFNELLDQYSIQPLDKPKKTN